MERERVADRKEGLFFTAVFVWVLSTRWRGERGTKWERGEFFNR